MAPPRAVVHLRRWLESTGGTLQTVRYARESAGGAVEAWRLTPAEARRRVVAVHGTGNDALYPQVALFRALCGAGCEVFAFDLDGHGAQSTTMFSVDGIRSALPAAVGEAERGRDALPLHLLGHSLGGALVLDALAAGSVPGAQSAIVISPPLRVELSPGGVWRELRGFLHPATLRQRRHYGVWGLVPAAGPLKRRAYPIRGATRAGAPFSYARAVDALLRDLKLERRAPSIEVPVLLVHGGADGLATPAASETLHRLIPRAALRRVPGATHWGTLLDDAVPGVIVEWLASAHLGAAAPPCESPFSRPSPRMSRARRER